MRSAHAMLVALAALVCVGCASKKEAPLVISFVPPPAPPTLDDYALPGPLFLQRDPRWMDIPLGRSRHTIGSGGCMLCCVAMAFNHLGVETDPARLAQFLNGVGGFTASGDLIWTSSAAYGEGRLGVDYVGGPDHARIDASLAQGVPVVARVQIAGKGQHWVLVVGKLGEEYLVRDPIRPEDNVQRLSAVAQEITAIRIFRRA